MKNLFFEIKVPGGKDGIILRKKFNTYEEAKKFADWNYGEGYPYEVSEIEITVKPRKNSHIHNDNYANLNT